MYPAAPINEGTQAFVKQKIKVADPTGFEPAISALTGPRVGPLHYGSNPTTKDTANGDSMVDYTLCQQGGYVRSRLVEDLDITSQELVGADRPITKSFNPRRHSLRSPGHRTP